MMKWKLLFTTLPFVAGILFIIAIRNFMGIPGVVEFSDINPILTSVALVIAFMLGGVIADYKESEKLPGEMASQLETLYEMVMSLKWLEVVADISPKIQKYDELTQAIDDWLTSKTNSNPVYQAIEAMNELVPELSKKCGPNYAIRFMSEIHALRKIITRIVVIRRTSFISTGYALLEALAAGMIFLLMLCNYKTPIAQYLVVGFFSFLYIYMIRLIYDIDNPFEFHSEKQFNATTEVDLFPIRDLKTRLIKS